MNEFIDRCFYSKHLIRFSQKHQQLLFWLLFLLIKSYRALKCKWISSLAKIEKQMLMSFISLNHSEKFIVFKNPFRNCLILNLFNLFLLKFKDLRDLLHSFWKTISRNSFSPLDLLLEGYHAALKLSENSFSFLVKSDENCLINKVRFDLDDHVMRSSLFHFKIVYFSHRLSFLFSNNIPSVNVKDVML